MAVEDEKNEALEEVKDIEGEEGGEEQEDGLPPEKKPPNKLLIGGLSLVIFFALFMFFRGENEPPQQVVEGPNITTPGEKDSPEITLPREEAFEGAIIEEPPAGEILIQSEDGNIEAIMPNEAPVISIPEKELAFFEALKKNRENRPTSPEQDDQLSRQAEKAPPSPKQRPRVKPVPETKPKKIVQDKQPVLTPDFPFTIQLGAFKKESAASTLSDRLKKSGYDAYILAVRTDLFRVRVGVFQSRSEAKAVADQIRTSDRIDSFIVKR